MTHSHLVGHSEFSLKQFKHIEQRFDGLHVLQRYKRADDRGFFQRLFDLSELEIWGWEGHVQQVNHTMTQKQGSIRGMHMQLFPHAEMKWITCLKGIVFDVLIDMRPHSSTFLKWHGWHLSEENQRSIVVPAGFAHGFQTLSHDVEMLYCHNQIYAPNSEYGLNAFDTQLNIDWPLPVTQLSEKDKAYPVFNLEHYLSHYKS